MRHELDVRSLKCPTPVLKMSTYILANEVGSGDILAVIADCSTFEEDVRRRCTTMKKVLVVCRDYEKGGKLAEVRI